MLYQQLVTFSRIVEVGSFTRAAELLNLSQPAVTRQIAALEAEMGGPLLERGRNLHLTPRGQIVLQHARQIEAVIRDCRTRVATLSQGVVHGEIAISCVTTTGLFTLPALMARFSEQHPDVRFRVWSGRIAGVMDRVLSAEVDLGLVTMPVSHRSLTSIPLFGDPVVLVAAPATAARLSSPLSAAQLGELDMIAYEAPSRFRTFVDAMLEQAGVYPRVTMELESHEAVKTMVHLGYGVALVPESAVAAELRGGSLVRVSVAGLPEAGRTTCLLLRNETTLNSAVQAFVDVIIQRFRQERPDHFSAAETFDAMTEG